MFLHLCRTIKLISDETAISSLNFSYFCVYNYARILKNWRFIFVIICAIPVVASGLNFCGLCRRPSTFYHLSKQANGIQELTNIFWLLEYYFFWIKRFLFAGECISGALYWKELFTLAAEIGFSRPFLVTAAPVPIDREDFKKILGRIFKKKIILFFLG